jgi:hypothetical protein
MKRYILLQTLISLAVGLSIAFYAYPLLDELSKPAELPFVGKVDKKIGWDSGWDGGTRGGPTTPIPTQIDWDLWLSRGADIAAILVLVCGPIGSWLLYRRQQAYVEMLLILAGERRNA